MSDHQATVDALLTDYHRSREQLAEVQRALASIRESAESDDGLVTAVVDQHGTLVRLTIDDEAYRRYPAAELGPLIVRTATAAAAKAAEVAHQAMAPVLPEDVDPAELLAGRADLSAEEFAHSEPVEVTSSPPRPRSRAARLGGGDSGEEFEESMEHVTWMTGSADGGAG
ncbi:MAG: YbaB/EbfC family nucleoid-associated protein [Sciscionella sp.]|nr:YbaB/EbfC family nucleoid-associated protein [Sciscionella sp.]